MSLLPTASDVGHPLFMSPHVQPIAKVGSLIYVVNTPGDTADVIGSVTHLVVARTDVGIDPVSIAVRPDASAQAQPFPQQAATTLLQPPFRDHGDARWYQRPEQTAAGSMLGWRTAQMRF